MLTPEVAAGPLIPMLPAPFDPMAMSLRYQPNGQLTLGIPTPIIGPVVAPIAGVFPVSNPPALGRVKLLTDPNDDPDYQKRTIKYFYQRLEEVYLGSSLSRLLRYVVVRNGQAALVSSAQEYDNNDITNNQDLRIKFILDKYFSKYDMEMLLHKVVFENGLNWYDLRNKHSQVVKKYIYKRIKHRLQKHLRF
jgi:hypothetical protein